ncbi:hypothetical protein J5N97_003929 [Dioscorea zingiberensis]|uniref:Uncharacterized protein n=1 Tax=Dioscorea zingiberensis TaxID=325984 RepID=A0A9D5D5N1_9LILI|nr:hypothetical protein J5N97_003929 [Dioscorea zingiberensis]
MEKPLCSSSCPLSPEARMRAKAFGEGKPHFCHRRSARAPPAQVSFATANTLSHAPAHRHSSVVASLSDSPGANTAGPSPPRCGQHAAAWAVAPGLPCGANLWPTITVPISLAARLYASSAAPLEPPATAEDANYHLKDLKGNLEDAVEEKAAKEGSVPVEVNDNARIANENQEPILKQTIDPNTTSDDCLIVDNNMDSLKQNEQIGLLKNASDHDITVETPLVSVYEEKKAETDAFLYAEEEKKLIKKYGKDVKDARSRELMYAKEAAILDKELNKEKKPRLKL